MKRLEASLANIAKLNAKVKAFVHLRDASVVKTEWNKIFSQSTAPISIGIKDNICTIDEPTTCASNILKGYMSPYNAHIVDLLKNSNQVAILGKTNMDEFAMGSNNEHTIYGHPINPRFLDGNKKVSTGGSSGGSAAAVASGMCDAALGTDTGGSVRLPSAFCSVVGFKPSYGLISRNGVISYAQSLDTVGVLGKDVSTAERVFDILNQYDPNDPTCLSPQIRARLPASSFSPEKLKVGIITETIIDLSIPVREAWIDALTRLQEATGCEIQQVSIPSIKSALPSYFIISPAEASSNLARYDGIRYGTRQARDRQGEVLYGPTRFSGFGMEVQRRLLLGTYSLSAGAYGNHFTKSQKVRRKIVHEFNRVFKSSNPVIPEGSSSSSDGVDVLIHPTGRTQPREYPLNETPLESYINDILTVPANLAGIPAISVPYGPAGVGMQVWGQYGDDSLVFDVARKLEEINNNLG